MKSAILISVIVLAACTTTPQRPPPLDVQLIPNDCANMTLIVEYLQQEANRPRATFESERDHDRYRSQMRQRIWTMRYLCQPV